MSSAGVYAFDTRIVECSACHRPTRGACEACGEALAPVLRARLRAAPDSSPYRAHRAAEDGRLLPFELVRAPADRDVAGLRDAWENVKPSLREPHDAETELRAAWLASMLSAHAVERGELLAERALLSTALEGMTRPIYRALVAARLARAAAAAGAVSDAHAWLDQAPATTSDASVDADLVIARAMIDRARGDLDAVLERVGATASMGTTHGAAATFAAVLRTDVFERRGDLSHAGALYREAEHAHGRARVQQLALRFDLAPRSRRGFRGQALATFGLVSAVATAVAWALSTIAQ